MKTAKFLFLACCILFNITAFAQEKKNQKVELKDVWIYSVPDAPYGYQDGTIEFKSTDEKLTAVAKIGGSSYIIDDIILEENQYSCSLYVDGSNVKIILRPGTKEITGTAFAEEWEMPITLTPQKK